MGLISYRKALYCALLACGMVAALACGGCSTTAGIEAGGKKSWNQEGAPELTKQVVLNDSRLADSLEIVELKHAMSGNLMKAQASLRSKERDSLPIQYKFDWYDANGMEIAANTAWKPLTIYARESKTIQGVAPDQRAQEFKLKIREPDAE